MSGVKLAESKLQQPESLVLKVAGHEIKISNPEKLLWPELGIKKIDYITKVNELAPYIIAHAKNRLLTAIRYPHGYGDKSFYQKNAPSHTPEWVETNNWHDKQYVLPNNTATLVWLANQAALEFHTAFNVYVTEDRPEHLVFDLDPSVGVTFPETASVALLVHEELEKLQIHSYAKLSGATGLQIYIPTGASYDYNAARQINHIFARYLTEKYPELITIERAVKKRGRKVYFDYLQMWGGKTIIAPYSPRATAQATVAVPIEWRELEAGAEPGDFTLLNISGRLKDKADLFRPLLDKRQAQNLDFVLRHFAKSIML